MKTKFEQALMCVVDIYHQYCLLDPVDDYLHPKEFQKLMKEQAQPFLKNCTPSNLNEDQYIKQIFQKADKDKNGYLKFTEFLYAFAGPLNDAHERSHQLDDDSKTGHGHGHGHDHGHGHGHGHDHGHSH